ncbi:MAG: FAD-dependent monooxygenase [Pseudomonadota bacterium]
MARSQRGQPSIVIVGGGHTGLLLALLLDHAEMPVSVVETHDIDAIMAAPFDGRALGLMRGASRVFQGIGLWPAFADIAEPVRGVRVCDEASGATAAFDAKTLGEEAFGYGITNRALRQRLLESCRARPGITLIAPASVTSLRYEAEALVVSLADGRELRPSLLVGADGRGSPVRDLAKIGARRSSYPQSAITFAFRLSDDHDQCVHEYLRPAGPLALLPIGRALISVTWIERHGTAARLMELDHQSLLREMQDRIGERPEIEELCGTPTCHPLGSVQANRYSAPRVALVGDAAHGLHPIHAQGFNLAVRDVATLAEIVVDGVRAGADPGGADILLHYDRRRRDDARITIGFTDGLNLLFSNDLVPAKWLRGLGLSAVDRVAPLKELVMRRGMGIAGDLPRLARGQAL